MPAVRVTVAVPRFNEAPTIGKVAADLGRELLDMAATGGEPPEA